MTETASVWNGTGRFVYKVHGYFKIRRYIWKFADKMKKTQIKLKIRRYMYKIRRYLLKKQFFYKTRGRVLQ